MTHSDLSRPTSGGTHVAPVGTRRLWFLTTTVVLFAFAVLAVATPPRASAISDEEELVRIGGIGSGAGQLKLPEGIASDPLTGHLYTAEEENQRISEFSPWGKFVKAFGFDVAPGAVNEQQEVRVRAAEGQFKLSFGASTTADLPFDAKASEVEAALNGLPSISSGGGSVSVEEAAGTTNGITPYVYVIAFKGALAATDVAQLEAVEGTTPLSGGVPDPSLLARTRADGTAGGTGLESCTSESGCKAGLPGPGAGQLSRPWGVAIDANGYVYEREKGNHRLQKFDSAGRFVWMAGGEVNKTKSTELGTTPAERNLCTAASADECGADTVGTGPGQFGGTISYGVALCPSGEALCPSGALFVADNERIQRFTLDGEFESQLPVPGEVVSALAFDPVSEDLYATYQSGGGVRKLDSVTGEEIGAPLAGFFALATDAAGNLFALSGNGVAQYNSSGNALSPPSCCEASPFEVSGLGTNGAGNLAVSYVISGVESFIRIFGPAPVIFEGPPPVPPTISAQFASSVQTDGASVVAEINPHFFANTRYFVQYGTGECSAGGCPNEKPLSPGPILTSKVTSSPLRSPTVFLEDLEPGTTYHYRFVAQSGGGGPVYGIDPDGDGAEEASSEDGLEASFTTFEPLLPPSCKNDAFRIGAGARLPDCRAFEMVSPVDKNNGDIKSLIDLPGYNTALYQSASGGERFTYSSYRAFANPKAAPWTSQYLASRDPSEGWSSEAINVPRVASGFVNGLFDNTYKGFTGDLCGGWLVAPPTPLLDPPRDFEGFQNLYRRDSCGGGDASYEALIPSEPMVDIDAFVPILQGTSADGKEAIFQVAGLEEASATLRTYYAGEGEVRPVCVLPDGTPSAGNCSGGTGGGTELSGNEGRERLTTLSHAISEDGSKAYWTDSAGQVTGPGKVYLRVNPGQEQSAIEGGECSEAEKACTFAVSGTLSGTQSKAARFLGASADGSKALFKVTEGTFAGRLFEFSAGEGSVQIAGKVIGVAAASDDLSHIYFISEEALPETSGAAAGKPNLYLDQEGTRTFIATLSKADVGEKGPSDASPEPIFHAARATADGSTLAFISTERLTGYDNTDLANGEANSEVYLYRAGAAGPVCVSCNPSGARPQGRLVVANGLSGKLQTAGALPMPETQLYVPRALSAGGERLFFNSYDALLPRDTNGKADVYEWESAPGKAACEQIGADVYVPSSEGCLSLISSGQSPSDSLLLDASADGRDAFFTTLASLLPQDPGLVDIYDARENGGLPLPPAPPGPCQGEACQFAPPPPNDPTPASASFKGAGNPGARSRCAKGKVARKGRCVARKRKKAKRHHSKRAANHNRGASR